MSLDNNCPLESLVVYLVKNKITWFNVDDSSDLRWIHLEPWSLCLEVNARRYEEGPGVKHLARIASRPVTWVIKIKHAGLNPMSWDQN